MRRLVVLLALVAAPSLAAADVPVAPRDGCRCASAGLTPLAALPLLLRRRR